MDAVKFLQERNRMYESGAATPSIGLEDDYNPANVVKIVEEWSAAHPRKTRQSAFLEQWPNAELDCQGVIAVDPCDVDKTMHGEDGDCYNGKCDDCRREFWGKVVE